MLKETIYSPVWWISVVVVGLLVSLSASYVKEFIDSFMGKISSKRRERNEGKRKAFQDKVKCLYEDKGEFIEYIQITNDLSHRFLAASLATIFIVGGLNLLLLVAGNDGLDVMAKGIFLSGILLLTVFMVYAYATTISLGKRRRVIDAVRNS